MTQETDKTLLRTLWDWLRLTCVHCARITWYIGVALFVLAAVAITIFRFWLPALADRKAEVESFLSQQIGQSVIIGEMAADWDSLYPALYARKLALESADGKEDLQLSLDELRLDMDILPLLQGKLVFREITLNRPVVHVSRSVEGDIYIGKFKAPPPNENRLALLFRQHKVTISNGIFSWHDKYLKENRFDISSINVSMENRGNRHIAEGSVQLPDQVANRLSLYFDVRGKVTNPSTWKGEFSTRIENLNLSGLPGILSEKFQLPSVSGIVSTEMTTNWRDGTLDAASGKLNGENFIIPLGRFGKPFSVRELETDFTIEHQEDNWLMTFENPMVGVSGEPWDAGRITAFSGQDEVSLQVEKVKMADIRPVLDALTSEHKIVQLVKDLYPSGQANDLSLTLVGPLNRLQDFHYRMSVTNASVNAYQFYPAATGLRGVINVTRSGGSVLAEGKNSRVVLEKVFASPLRVDSIQGNVTWTREDDAWVVNGSRLWMKNRDAEAVSRFTATIAHDRAIEPRLDLDVDLTDGNLSHADHYYPVQLMNPAVRKWFDNAGFRGRMNNAQLKYRGTAKGFPVRGATEFEVRANIETASLVFAEDWPRLTGVDGDLLIGRNDLWVTGSARDLSGQKVDNSVVHLSGLSDPGKQVVNISTGLRGKLSPVLEFLQGGPLFKGSAFRDLDLAARGAGQLKLDVAIPLTNTSATRLEGQYETAGAALKLPDDTWVTSIKGKLDFTEQSVVSPGLTGKMLGGPLSVNVATLKKGQPPIIQLKARGEAHASHLEPMLGEWLAGELSGKADWAGTMIFDIDKISLNARSTLAGMASAFPYPLVKETTETLPMELDVDFLPGNRIKLSYDLESMTNGKLYFSELDRQTALTGGCVYIGRGQASCDERQGVSVNLQQPVLDLDPWDAYIKKQEGDEGLPQVLTRMAGSIDTAFYSGINMADITLSLERQYDDSWQGYVEGDRIKGDLGFKIDKDARWVKPRLSYLELNKAEKESIPSPPQDPRRFPAVDMVVDDMSFHNMKLGKVMLQGEPTAEDWELQIMKLDRPDMKVTAKGNWKSAGGNHVSSFDVDFTSTDMETTLVALDYNIDFESELFRTTGKVSWPGAPYEYELGILGGELRVHSGKGRLSGVEVGAGRLLGVFNVESLRRRLLLDFSDLSKEGFAFDSIDADMSIKQGVADIPKLIMPGPSATIRLQGAVGLVKQDVDMKMSISPAVGGNLAVAGFVLGGPAGGVVTLLASKAIKDQMDKSVDYQYTIRGPWEDPVVDKIQSAAPQAGPTEVVEDTPAQQ